MDIPSTVVLLSMISAAAGAYFGAYLRKKGENLATHEDLSKLKDQVQLVTTTTKEIEAKISNEVWDRQKRWELKREVLFAVAKGVAEIDEALVGLESLLQIDQQRDELASSLVSTKKYDQWTAAARKFDEAKLLVRVACNKETWKAVEKFGLVSFQIAAELTKNKDALAYKNSQKALWITLSEAIAAVRKELGVEDGANTQGYSAGPTA